MSSYFELNQAGTAQLRERQHERLLEWAERIFAEPAPDGNGINPTGTMDKFTIQCTGRAVSVVTNTALLGHP